ncbi:magnesium and cobalt transport protein CorA [Marisediminicola sp. LYQ85]|uniref:magnesium and cobalt transport protein CorA n=1 Tax=Marisediminicola sp. LYQ85 TaxID=3391062 RepID=UPI0039834B32
MSAESRSSVVANVIYANGKRAAAPADLAATFAELEAHPDSMAWIGLYRPDAAELTELAERFDLHELAVEDAVLAHQRPKMERYGESVFLVLRAARYLDAEERVEFGELHIFVGKGYVVTVRHAEKPDLSIVRTRLEDDPELLALGPEAVLYGILDALVDGYSPVVDGLENDIDEIESQVFDGDPAVSRRIYELSREVIDFQLAAKPLSGILRSITDAFDESDIDPRLRAYLRDVDDHVVAVTERIAEFREVLRDMLTVNATLVAQRQNDEMQRVGVASNRQAEEARKISGWAAILFAPSLIGSVYGMNFANMPELSWQFGYPFALGLMVAASGTLFVVFRKRGWI